MSKKASEIIKQSCCGTLLDVPKCDLVKEVEFLEHKLTFLENQLHNALNEIMRLKKHES